MVYGRSGITYRATWVWHTFVTALLGLWAFQRMSGCKSAWMEEAAVERPL
jgi:hypothetical protein